MTDTAAVVVRIARNRRTAHRAQRTMDDLLLATGRAPPPKGGAKAAAKHEEAVTAARARLLAADDDEPQGVSVRVRRSRRPGAPLVVTIGGGRPPRGSRK